MAVLLLILSALFPATAFVFQTPSFRPQPTFLKQAKTPTAKARLDAPWYPGAEQEEELERKCLQLTADLIRKVLDAGRSPVRLKSTRAHDFAQGRFRDLCCTTQGSELLEALFLDEETETIKDDRILLGSIYALQSLCIMGMLVGVKGTPDQHERRVQHLWRHEWRDTELDLENLSYSDIQRLKYESDQTAGTKLLAELKYKRTTQGAMDVLVTLGAWNKHEDLALLRSGFPIVFSPQDLEAAEEATKSKRDIDDILQLRRDLTHLKTYTIDSVSTSEVDDGLSVEILDNGQHKLWIHIADADRWAPRDSPMFSLAKERTITHYLPTGPVPMFPASLSTSVMSLRTNTDVCALSLGVELNDDGSIVVDSIEVTQSRIRVTYRLSYDDVDDMLMEGVAYQEEFQLGILMNAATSRRKYREGRGSVEAMIPNPIPQSFVSIYDDMMEKDGIGIRISVGASNNSGQNRTSFTDGSDSPDEAENLVTVSDSNLLVTEMMILAGEALGKWKLRPEPPTFCGRFENTLTLPFRSQPKPDYRSNEKEYKILTGLLEYNKGGGYCHAWYARRFLSPVKIGPEANPHSGLGVDCYVQWTSPIRRFGDLQVHAAVKRFLRRKRIHDIIFAGESIPLELNQIDLGCPVPDSTNDVGDYMFTVDADIDYDWGSALLKASRVVNRQSQKYWLFEYLSRKIALGNPPSFNAIVLGCVDPERKQYAVYLPEIGFEHRYLSQKGYLQAGEVVVLKIQSVSARLGLLTLTP